MSIATYRSVIKNALRIFFIKLFPYVAILLVTILYSKKLGIADYGIYQDFWIKLLLTGTLAYAGIPVIIVTYTPDVIKGLYHQLVKPNLHWLLLWVLACTTVFAVTEIHHSGLSFLFTGLMLILYVLHSIQESLLMAARKMNALIFLNFLYGVYFIWIHIAVLDHYSLNHLLYLLLLGTFARAAFLTVFVYKIYSPVQSSLVSDMLRNAAKLWLHLGLYDLMQNIFRYLDKFIISILLSASLYAIYFNGSLDIPFLPYILGAVSGSVLLQLSGHKHQASYTLMRDASRLLSCIVFPLFFFLLFFRYEIFLVVFTKRFAGSVPIFAAGLMVLPLRSYNYVVLLQHRHQGSIINKGALMDIIIALMLIYPFYRLMGLPGVALSFVFSTYIQVSYYVYHIARLEQVAWHRLFPLFNWMWKFVLSGILFAGLHFVLPGKTAPVYVLVTGAVTLAVYSGALLLAEYRINKKITSQ